MKFIDVEAACDCPFRYEEAGDDGGGETWWPGDTMCNILGKECPGFRASACPLVEGQITVTPIPCPGPGEGDLYIPNNSKKNPK